jgi:ATP-dependent Lon protease
MQARSRSQVEKKIRSRVKRRWKDAKEYYLNEQMQAIQKDWAASGTSSKRDQEIEEKLTTKRMSK